MQSSYYGERVLVPYCTTVACDELQRHIVRVNWSAMRVARISFLQGPNLKMQRPHP